MNSDPAGTDRIEGGVDMTRAEILPQSDRILNQEQARRQRESTEREARAQASTLDRSRLHEWHEIPGASSIDVPAHERTPGETLSLDEWLGLRGAKLVDASGDEIGAIVEVYFDEATRQPEWIGVAVPGYRGSHRRVVAPVHGCYVFGDLVSVTYARELIVGSEVIVPQAAGDGTVMPGPIVGVAAMSEVGQPLRAHKPWLPLVAGLSVALLLAGLCRRRGHAAEDSSRRLVKVQ